MSDGKSLTITFRYQQSPFEIRCECEGMEGVVGLGVDLEGALRSWIEALPGVIVRQRSELESIRKQLDEAAGEVGVPASPVKVEQEDK